MTTMTKRTPAIEDPTAAGVTLDVRGHPRTDTRPLRAPLLSPSQHRLVTHLRHAGSF